MIRSRRSSFQKRYPSVEWNNTTLLRSNLQEEIMKLKQQPGKNICIGSLSIAAFLAQLGLIDEYYIVVHPVIVGKGPRLFETADFKDQFQLTLVKSTPFHSGAVALQYKKISSKKRRYSMQKLHYSIVINAPAAKVWTTMLDDKSYRQWTEAFSPGSYYKGDWNKGSKILFLAPGEKGESGMVSRIKENRKH